MDGTRIIRTIELKFLVGQMSVFKSAYITFRNIFFRFAKNMPMQQKAYSFNFSDTKGDNPDFHIRGYW